MTVDGSLRLAEASGFVFDVDGTLVHRGPEFRARPVPGAIEVLDRIRSSGRRRMGGSHTILVRSGTTGHVDLENMPARLRPGSGDRRRR